MGITEQDDDQPLGAVGFMNRALWVVGTILGAGAACLLMLSLERVAS